MSKRTMSAVALASLALLYSTAASAEAFRVTFLDHATPPSLEVGRRECVPIALRNDGTLPWKRSETVRLAYHWLDRQGNGVIQDGERTTLPKDVEPGQFVALCANVVAPDRSGDYQLQWDMVQEGVTWFSAENPANALSRPVSVLPAATFRPSRRSVLTALEFWLITIGSFLLTAFWVRAWWGRDIATRDEFLFYAVLLGIGQLFVVLQALVFTVGMTLSRVGLVLAVAHSAMAVARWRARDRR